MQHLFASVNKMTNKIIDEQLRKVENADLSHYNKETNTYFIPKKQEIKIEENSCYIIRLKPSAFTNSIVTTNWNNGNIPTYNCYKADISKKMSGMIKILGVSFDLTTQQDLNTFWSGWLSLSDVEVIEKL